VSTLVDTSLYPLEVVLRTCHRFTDKFFLHVQWQDQDKGRLEVTLKSTTEGKDSGAAVGDFLNELLDQTVRQQVAEETEELRNLILAHALSETQLVRPELESSDPREDPIGIGTPDERN